MSDADRTGPALLAGSVRLPLWLVQWQAAAEMEAIHRALSDHLEYVLELERRGVLFASGPLFSEGGSDRGAGMTLLRVASAAEAVELADADPLVRAGLRTYSLQRWMLVEGEVTLRVRFSDGSVTLTP